MCIMSDAIDPVMAILGLLHKQDCAAIPVLVEYPVIKKSSQFCMNGKVGHNEVHLLNYISSHQFIFKPSIYSMLSLSVLFMLKLRE
jgi:hypothetical protein